MKQKMLPLWQRIYNTIIMDWFGITSINGKYWLFGENYNPFKKGSL
jgi:hypothetical protein